MFIAIAVQRLPSGLHRARAPELEGVELTDPDAGNVTARLRLVIEGVLADRLLAGTPLPAGRPPAHWAADPAFTGARWYEVHMNLGHIEALARHQSARLAGR